MENEEQKEMIKEESIEDTKIAEKTIVGGIENPKQNLKKDTEVSNKKGLSIASLVLGIVSIVFCFIYVISIPCAILALTFGIICLKSETKGMAIAGIVTGAISLVLRALIVLFIFTIIALSIGFGGLTELIEDEDDDYNYSYDSFYDEEYNL